MLLVIEQGVGNSHELHVYLCFLITNIGDLKLQKNMSNIKSKNNLES